MRVNCYPTLRKQKALDVCNAFATGCDGDVATDGRLRDGPAMFYGVNDTIADVWRAVLKDGRTFYYADNSYFDATREIYFRVTRNAVQHSGLGESDGKRFREIGLRIAPWRREGRHVIVCIQSEPFMRLVAQREGWTNRILAAVRERTDRPIRARPWSAHKAQLGQTLRQDLIGAHCLVTWSSAAAIQAILAGVPAICLGPCAAAPMAGASLDDLDAPPTPDGRETWAGVLADNQWTLAEMRVGKAWNALQ